LFFFVLFTDQMFVTVLILCSILPIVNCVLCNGYNETLMTPMNSSLIDVLENWTMQNIIGEHHEMCQIEVMIEYLGPLMTLKFKNAVENMEEIDGNTILTTFIDFENETSLQTNVLRYSCSNFDYCEIDFLFKHIPWLIIDKYQPKFGNSILSLLYSGNISVGMYILQINQFNFIFHISRNLFRFER